MSATDKLVVTLSKVAVIAHPGGMVVGVNSPAQMASMDGTAPSPAAVRMERIVMEQMEGVCVQQASREISVSKSARKGRLVRHAVRSAIVGSSSVTLRMESVYVRLGGRGSYVRRSVGLEGMGRVAPTSVNASMELVAIRKPANAVAPQDGSVQHVK